MSHNVFTRIYSGAVDLFKAYISEVESNVILSVTKCQGSTSEERLHSCSHPKGIIRTLTF